MSKDFVQELLFQKRVFVFIGGSGSGKSEIAINFALKAAEIGNRPVDFFDMDQTKSIFRSRDAEKIMIDKGITVHSAVELLDAPVVPHAVNTYLEDDDRIVIMDVGGNQGGARSIGQYSKLLNKNNSEVFFVVNSYRPFFRNSEEAKQTVDIIKNASGIEAISIISNPNMGKDTTLNEIISGHESTKKLFDASGYDVSFLAVSDKFYSDILNSEENKVLKISSFLMNI